VDIKKRLNELMKLKGIRSVWELAKISGVPATTLDGILNKANRSNGPRIDTLNKICNALGTTLVDFLSGVEVKEEKMAAKYNIGEEQMDFLMKNMHDENFLEALRILKTLSPEARAIMVKACELVKKENFK
jgi:transcriptional regulator with XRE-family HTH domain